MRVSTADVTVSSEMIFAAGNAILCILSARNAILSRFISAWDSSINCVEMAEKSFLSPKVSRSRSCVSGSTSALFKRFCERSKDLPLLSWPQDVKKHSGIA